MKVEIFGGGCAKCKLLEKRVRKVVKELNGDIEITKVEDVMEIMNRGVTLTPALAVNGEIKIEGRIPTVDEIRRLLKKQ